LASTVAESRYGKWMLGAARGELGISVRDGQPIAEKLKSRAPLTFLMTALAMLLSYAIAVPIGAFAAWRRGRPVEVAGGVCALAGLQFPTLLGGAFVIEEVFGLPGLGWETLRAVEADDGAWLVVTVLVTAVVTTAALVASDVAYGLLDPRVRESLGGRRGNA